MKMKKILFLGLSICGVSNLANAWVSKFPQFITVGGGGTTSYSCKNKESAICMSGEGQWPETGKGCYIHHGGRLIPGIVTSVRFPTIYGFGDGSENNPGNEWEYLIEEVTALAVVE